MDSDSRVCLFCELPYQVKKSTSRWLRYQFCSYLCERAENGGTIEDFLAIERFGLPYSTLMKAKYKNEIGELLLR